MHRRTRTLTAALGAAGMLTLAAGPAMAAEVARAEATALRVQIAGNGTDSGTYTSTHDGEQEARSGSNTPALGLLGGQQLVTAGVLGQDARTSGDSRSAACAGLAGDGATVVGIGDTPSCFSGGGTASLSLGSLDLRDLEPITEGDLPAEITDPLNALPGQLAPVLDAINQAVEETGQQDAGIFLTAQTIEGLCVAEADRAGGFSTLQDAGIVGRFGDQEVTLLAFETEPAPNTEVVADPEKLAQLIRDALVANFEESFDGDLAQLNQVLGGTEELDQYLAQLGDGLAPATSQLATLTLNKQNRPTEDSIEVTALDLQVAPAAQEQLGSSLAGVQIGDVMCGPSGTAEPVATQPEQPTKLPRAVPAGLDAAAPAGDQGGLGAGLVGLAVLGTAIAVGARRAS